jgi:hypothetical protein
MKQLTVKIERRFLHLAETETKGRRSVIKSARSFPLPARADGGALFEDPDALARFILDSIKKGRLAIAPAALLLHSEIAPHHEFYHRKLSSFGMLKRARTEAESSLSPGLGRRIFEYERYNEEDESNNQTSALFAVNEGFLRGLARSLKSGGIKSRFASSSLAVWSELMRNLLSTLVKNDVRFGPNPLCLDINEDCVRFLFFVQARLVHRCESALPEGISDDELLSRIEEKTQEIVQQTEGREGGANAKPDCILFVGTRVNAPDFADRLAGRLNTPCKSLDSYVERLRSVAELGGDLEDKDKLYARVVSRAGVIPRRQKELNLLYGGCYRRQERGVARAAAVLLTVTTLAAMSAMPLMNWNIEKENAEDIAIITRPTYADAREQLAEQRQLNAMLQSNKAEESYLQNKNLHYGDLLYQLSRELLAESHIERMTHEDNGDRMEVTFVTADPDYFLAVKEKINKSGNISVTEPVVMTRMDESLWRCVVTVSWEVPATGGVSE